MIFTISGLLFLASVLYIRLRPRSELYMMLGIYEPQKYDWIAGLVAFFGFIGMVVSVAMLAWRYLP